MTDEDTDFARSFLTAIHCLSSELGHDKRKLHEAYHAVFNVMRHVVENPTDTDAKTARPSLIPSLCTRFTRARIEWRR